MPQSTSRSAFRDPRSFVILEIVEPLDWVLPSDLVRQSHTKTAGFSRIQPDK